MAGELFVDTSGFFALLAKRDPSHASAARILQRAAKDRRRLLTTDYVLDETAMLLKARGEVSLASSLFERVFTSNAARIEWTTDSRFRELTAFFLKHPDQSWSFTDCLSFLVMKEQRIHEALTTDDHFQQAGFRALLKR